MLRTGIPPRQLLREKALRVACALSRPSPQVCAIHVRFPASRARRCAGARSPSARKRSEQCGTLPFCRLTAGGGSWRYRKDSRLPSPTPSTRGKARPWRRTKTKPAGRRTEVPAPGEEGVGRGPVGAASPFCGRSRRVTRGARGWRSGSCVAPSRSLSAALEVRDKYPLPVFYQGRGLGGLALAGKAPAWVGSWRSAQFALQSQHRSRKQPGTRPRGGEERCAARAARLVSSPENLLRYQTRPVSLLAPRYSLQKKGRP